jgi:hypothetical protein
MSGARIKFIAGLIGTPYKENAKGPLEFDCWHAVRYVRMHLFQDVLPEYVVPEEPTLLWLAHMFKNDSERSRWQQTDTISDGCLVLMSKASQAVHIGIWLKEGGVLHATKEMGIVFQDELVLKASGWGNLRFFERAHEVANA